MQLVVGGTNGLLEAALSYAAEGLRVIPLHSPRHDGCSCGRAKCSSVGKHPRIKDWPGFATVDPTLIESWWSTYPESNIGIVTGAESGIFVVDIDGDEGNT